LEIEDLVFGDSVTVPDPVSPNFDIFGYPLTITRKIEVSTPDTSHTSREVTIHCGLTVRSNFLVEVTSSHSAVSSRNILNLQGSVAIDGRLRLSAGVRSDDGAEINLAGVITGTGDIESLTYTDSVIDFMGPNGNTFNGVLTAETSGGGATRLNKQSGNAVTGGLIISEGATVRLLSSHQIADAAPVQMAGGAKFFLQGYTETIGSLALTNAVGDTSAASVDTGGAILSVLGDVVSVNQSSVTPIISGRLELPSGNHTIHISGTVYSGLDIQAQMLGFGNFTKTGNAALILSTSNSFNSSITISQGVLDVRHGHALGDTAGSTAIDGGNLTLRNVSILDELLFALSGDGTGEFPGAVLTVIGAATWSGQVALYTNLVVAGGDMVFSGPISGTGGLGCFSGGTMTLGGTLANTYTGKTLVRCPLLQLIKPFGINAYAGPLEVGGGFGGPYQVSWNFFYQTPNTPVTLFANGVLNLNHQVENFGPIIFNGGTINTGTGFIIAENTITANPATSTAIINGNLSLSVNPFYLIVSNGVAEPDLLINATISGSNMRKQGPGTLTLTSANTHTGYTVVEDGILAAEHPSVFGGTSGNTIVWSGATIRLGGIDGMSEAFQIEGTGFQGTNGALQVATGGNMYGSGLWLSGPATINSLPGSSLTINAIIEGNGPLTKSGSGTLTLSGSTANSYSGGTLVSAGALQLFKTPNVIATPGPLTVGPATVSSPATARCFNIGMIPSGGTVTVNANSLLDLNGYNQTLAQLNLNDGGDAQTGTGTLGFPAGGNINVGTLNPGLPGLQRSASISGKIALPPLDYLTFNVSGYGQTPLTFDPELDVPAFISGGGNIVKNGGGAMRLSGANTFNDSPPFAAGDLIINAGTVIAASNGALGGTAGWTWVLGGGRLSLINNITIADETLYLSSTNSIALDNPGGNNFWTGPVTLARDSVISVNQDWSLFLYGVVSGSSPNDLTKVGAGALIFGGGSANTYSGETFINAGELHLAKPSGLASVPGALSIGNDAGAIATVRNYQSYQVNGNIFINRNGTLHVNGYEENVDHLYLADGGDVQTDAGVLYLKVGGSLTVTPGNNNNPSTISGNVDVLPGTFPLNINAAPILTGEADLNITARVSSSAGAANLQKNGAGWLRLAGPNTYSGATIVNDGKLQVDGSQPQSPVSLDNDTRLLGNGTVGHVTLNGSGISLAPGNSPGLLTSSNLDASGGNGTLEIELNGTSAGSSYDQINVRGSVNLTGLKLSGTLGFTSAVGDQFTLINNDGSDAVTGTFTGLAQNGKLYLGGELFQINYAGGSGNDVVLTRLVTPPPPTLIIQRASTNSVRLTWATNDPPFRLLSNTNATGSDWIFNLPPPIIVGTNHVVTNVTLEARKFYRLVNP